MRSSTTTHVVGTLADCTAESPDWRQEAQRMRRNVYAQYRSSATNDNRIGTKNVAMDIQAGKRHQTGALNEVLVAIGKTTLTITPFPSLRFLIEMVPS